MKRHYVRVSPFALSTIIDALDTDRMVSNITVSMEDDDLLVAFDYDKYKPEKERKLSQTSENRAILLKKFEKEDKQ